MEVRLRQVDGIPTQVVGEARPVGTLVEVRPEAVGKLRRVQTHETEGDGDRKLPSVDAPLLGEAAARQLCVSPDGGILLGGERLDLGARTPATGLARSDAVELEVQVRRRANLLDEELHTAVGIDGCAVAVCLGAEREAAGEEVEEEFVVAPGDVEGGDGLVGEGRRPVERVDVCPRPLYFEDGGDGRQIQAVEAGDMGYVQLLHRDVNLCRAKVRLSQEMAREEGCQDFVTAVPNAQQMGKIRLTLQKSLRKRRILQIKVASLALRTM